MSQRPPIRTMLQDDASEAELQRVWRGVQKRRAAGPSPRRRWVAALAAASLLVLAWALQPFFRAAGPLRDEQGRPLGTLGSAEAGTARLADGSRIELSPNTQLEVLDNDGTTFACALRRGRTLFDVIPGGPRRWRIEVGAVRVEVVGTRFSVERGANGVSVAVERGTVIVRGEGVPDGVQKLEAGKTLLIESAEARSKPPAANPPPPTPSLDAAPSAAPSAGARPSPGKTGGDLLKFADEERRRGNLAGAVQALRAVVDDDPSRSRRAIAAFTLGKLLLDGENRPSEAKAALRTCLRLSPPAAVAEDALARIVEAEARGGAAGAARSAAQEYEKRYPSGRRLADVRRWANIR